MFVRSLDNTNLDILIIGRVCTGRILKKIPNHYCFELKVYYTDLKDFNILNIDYK